jgi:GTP1/Obg family GTP-binding protein
LLSVQVKTTEWSDRRITLNQSTDHLRAPIDFRSINEIQIESRLSEIQKLILNQNEKLFQQQQQLDGLARGFLDIVQVLQQKGDPTKKIEKTNQSVIILGNALIDFKKQLKQANFGQEFADLKTHCTIGMLPIKSFMLSLVHKYIDMWRWNLAFLWCPILH